MCDSRERIDQLAEELNRARNRIAELESAVSDLRQCEDDLRKITETYDRHFSIANDVIYTYDSTFTLLSVSPNVERILGYKPEELIGKKFHEINVLDEEDLDRALNDALYILSGGKINTTVYQFITRDGSRIFGGVSGIPLTHEGMVTGVISVARDITERIELQKAFREEAEKYLAHFSLTNDVLYALDTQLKIRTVSPSVENALGFRPEELIGKNLQEIGIIHPGDVDRAISDTLRMLSGEKTESSVYRFFNSKGEVRFGEVRGIPLMGKGRISGVVAVVRDVTGRIKAQEKLRKYQDHLEELVKERTEDLTRMNEYLRQEIEERTRTEEALRLSEDKYRLLVENASEGIFVAQDGMLKYVNPKVSEVSGYTREELTSRPFDFLIHPDDLAVVSDRHRRRMKGEVLPDTYCFRIVDKNGRIKWLEIHAVFIQWEGRIAALTFIVDITERKMAEDALRISEAKYRMLYDGMEDGVIIADFTGKLLEFNEAYRKMTGYEPDELHKLTYMDLTPPIWHEYEAEILKNQTIVKGYSEPYEKEYIRKDGTVFPIELRTYLLKDDNDKPLAMWATVRDITDRKRAEEALRESEERLRGIAENLPGAVYQFYARDNGEMGLYYISERTKYILGLDNRDEEFFERFTSCIAPEDREGFLKSIREKAQSSSNWDYEVRFLSPSGEEKFIRGISRPRRVGKELIFDGVLLDVTNQRRAEIALRESERRFRDLAENTSDLIWETDEQLRFTYMSQKVMEHLGYGPEDRVGRTLLDVIPSEDAERIRPFLLSLMESPQAFQHLEYSALHQDGSLRVREASGVPIYDNEGRHVGYRGITRDITERRRVEEDLRNSESKHRFLTEKMNDIIWTMDLNLRTTYVSPSVTKLLGYTPEERMLQDPRDQLTEESYAYVTGLLAGELVRESRKGVDPDRKISMEVEYLCKDGSTLWMENVVSGIRDTKGTLIGLHGVSRDITDRKMAEERIQASEKKFFAVFHSSPVPMVVSQPEDGMIMDCNLSCERWSGYSHDELIGHTTLEIGLWLDAYDRECFVSGVVDESFSDATEILFRIKNGSIRNVLLSSRLIEVEGRSLMLTQVVDITERKKAEERIQASEKKFSAAFNSSPAPMVITYLEDGMIMDANQACQDWSGYTLAEAVGRTTTEMGFWQEPDKRSVFIRGIMEKGTVDGLEMKYINRNGETRDVLHSARLIEIDEKECLLSHIQDITEKKQAEKALRESEERLRGIANNFPGVVFQFYARDNGEMGVYYLSEQTMDVMGLGNDTSDFLDRAIACIVPEDRELFHASIREVIRAESSWDYTCRFIKPDGKEIFVQGISQPVRHGDELVFSGVLFDITKQKLLDEELKRHRDQLEEMVMSRTSDLTDAMRKLTQEIEIRKKTEATLRFSEMELQNRGVELEEMNAALKILLRQREEDRSAMEMNIISNMKTFVLPYIEKLEATPLEDLQMKSISMIRAHLEEITSPFTRRISSEFLGLTPAEIQVASLIREGKSSKDIAKILNISLNTVHTYRFNIRKKTGLKNNKVNLRSYLKTLD